MSEAAPLSNLSNHPLRDLIGLEALAELLAEENAETLARLAQLERDLAALPASIDGETANGRAGDFVRKLQLALKDIEALRVAQKAPWERRADLVHGFFVARLDRLKKIKATVQERQKAYQDRVVAEERRRREEAARKAEAEAKARREAEAEAARKAEAARQEALRLQREAEAREAERRAAEEKREAERRAAEAAEVADQRRQEEARREERERAPAPAPAPAPEPGPEPGPAPELGPAPEPAPAPATVKAAEKAADRAEIDAVLARDERRLAEAAAEHAMAKAAAKTADLARTRSDYGSLSTLQEQWTFRELDRQKLALGQLRQHIPQDALEAAVRSFIKAGGRRLTGVKIFKTTVSQVR